MTKPILGQQFNRLTITRDGPRKSYGGRSTQFWWCSCQCGREELVPQPKLEKFGECSVCRRGPCVVCSGPIEQQTRANTCSKACTILKRQNTHNKSYSKRSAADPDYNKKRHRNLLDRMDADPEYADNIRALRRQSGERYRSQSHVQVQNRDYQREYKRRYYDWLQQNPEALAAYKERQRAWQIERQRLQALSELRAGAEQLQEKLNHDATNSDD